MTDKEGTLVCVGCGNPADMDGSTRCECATGVLSTRKAGSMQYWSPSTYDANIKLCEEKIISYRESRQTVMNEIARRLTQ
jgi:hypothetical protein